ncbi:MAG: hypothetical protein Q4C98_03755 [Capnocytophaga sp.]|nr:hypothetical protein [Capnocytophaga sp.]MDO4228904.1 hypothetical protein [Capnocytophaga sp.]
MNFQLPNIDKEFGENFEENARQVILKSRQNFDENLLQSFKFTKNSDQNFDENFYQKQALVLILSTDFNSQDKPLIRWLICDFCKSIQAGFWVDLRSVMALLGFMLYKNMENSDLPFLYMTKFEACSDSAFSVDIEIVLGFDEQQSIDYLNDNKKANPQYKKIIQTIKKYSKNKTTPFRTYAEYCDFFENYRFAIRQEQIAEDCGLIEWE